MQQTEAPGICAGNQYTVRSKESAVCCLSDYANCDATIQDVTRLTCASHRNIFKTRINIRGEITEEMSFKVYRYHQQQVYRYQQDVPYQKGVHIPTRCADINKVCRYE